MKYPIDVERMGTGAPRIMMFGLTCALTGGSIGILIALTGYLPRIETLVMIPAGAIVGSAAGVVLGLALYYLMFAERLTNRVFYTVASVAAVVGILSGLALRVATGGEGAWLALFPTIISTIILAIWLRVKDPVAS